MTTPPQQTTFSVYGALFKVDVRYQFIAALGRGSYGIVCSARDLVTGEKVAIKRVSPMARKQNDAKHTLREICLMQSLGAHPNVVGVKNMSVNVADDELYIVMDFMDTDMHRVIQSSQPLSESHYKFFLHQILRGVKHLHDNGVLHRDLKPGNILVTKNCQVKIADFGLARSVPKRTISKPRPASAGPTKKDTADSDWQPMTEHVVTRWYRAPELMLQPDGQYNTGVDMWSVGCIFAEILGRKAFFPGKNFIHQLTLIFDVIGTPCTNDVKKMKSTQAQRFIKSLGKKAKVPFRTLFPTASPDAIDLLDKLLQFDPTARCTVDEALAHPYMQGIDKRYAYKDISVPAGRLQMPFESQNVSRNDLVKLIQQEVNAFHANSVAPMPTPTAASAAPSDSIAPHATASTVLEQTPAGLRTIHALSRQCTAQDTRAKETGRVTCQNVDLVKSMLGATRSTPTSFNNDVATFAHPPPPPNTPPPRETQSGHANLPLTTQNSDPPMNATLTSQRDSVQVMGLTSLLPRTRPTSAARARPIPPATQPSVLASHVQPSAAASVATATTSSSSLTRPTSAARTRPPVVIPTHAAADDQPAQSSSSSSSDDDHSYAPRPTGAAAPRAPLAATSNTPSMRPKSAPGRTALQKQSAPCVGSTASLIRSTQRHRKPSRNITGALPDGHANQLPEGQQDNDIEPAKRGKKLTVPVSPKFSVMSWQKARPATAKHLSGGKTTAPRGVKKR
ncbi:CMGC/MAPK protein kinase [Aphanomyces invadans]|uniref:CMGC/MAPK protein kinase n=1 Tax=Aphanomyces invadans TaxID=157072 RepID=A0A024UVC5_9STRA|nr:CMGC/MAPK protein kinase [Aphanomyces invadans]ETW09608.1 CMGC/MAPK protein kinase [Aphanomyces invadans]|eukprot:XP_008861019.1 CMGC/MAPK protein kinase [Aphanomyces invadans]